MLGIDGFRTVGIVSVRPTMGITQERSCAGPIVIIIVEFLVKKEDSEEAACIVCVCGFDSECDASNFWEKDGDAERLWSVITSEVSRAPGEP